MIKHWRTSIIGLCSITLGFWSAYVHWVPSQSFYFNVVYVEVPYITLIGVGIALLHAADHKNIPPKF